MTAVAVLLSAAVGYAVTAGAVLLAARRELLAAAVRTDKAFLSVADKVLAVRFFECRQHDRPLIRPPPLQQSALHGLVLGRFRHKDRLHRARVDLGVVHRGGQRTRSRIKVLHLLRHIADTVEILCQHDGIVERSARMRAHQIGHKVLFAAQLLVDAGIALAELLVYRK